MRGLGLILSLLLPLMAQAEYPYSDPYYATISAGLVKKDERDRSVIAEELSFSPIESRNNVPYFGGKNSIKVKYWPGKENAPLMLMVAGLGGTANTNTLDYLAQKFNKNGAHVVVFPSPFHWSFAVGASQSGYPGITLEDAKDQYELIQIAIQKLRSQNINFGQVGLLGVSMGALEAGFLSTLDKRENKVGIAKTLMINPPIDMYYGMDTLDSLYADKQKLSVEDRADLKQRLLNFFLGAVLKDIKSPEYFLNLDTRLPLSEMEKKIIIGQSMRDFLATMIFATQQIRDRGILRSPLATQNPDPRLEECGDFNFRDYIDKFLIPDLSDRRGYAVTPQEIAKDSFMSGIENELRENNSVYVMHNADDFIVNAKQLTYLQNIFGMRMRLYPHGGHLGNIWYPDNLEAILGTFSDL